MDDNQNWQKENLDPDIQQGKADLMRAISELSKPDENTETETPRPEQLSDIRSQPGREATSDIPQFDLANRILAEQRRINAQRRQGPAKSSAQQEPVETNNAARSKVNQGIRKVVQLNIDEQAQSRQQQERAQAQPENMADKITGRYSGRLTSFIRLAEAQERILSEIVSRDISKYDPKYSISA